MPGQSTMGRQEGQAGEMRGIGGTRGRGRDGRRQRCSGAVPGDQFDDRAPGAGGVGGWSRRSQGPSLVNHSRTRSEEHTSELQSLMRISYAVFCLKKKKKNMKRRSNEANILKMCMK